MQENNLKYLENESIDFKNEILRYASFWPYLLILLAFFLFASFLYLRYTSYTLKTTTVIEILDESQDNEMALPTELTVFNRSMINLENEINRLNSYDLNHTVVKDLNSNVNFYKQGIIKRSQTSASEWFDDYTLNFKIDTDLIEKKSIYIIKVIENNLEISLFDEHGNFIRSFEFASLSTLNNNNDLPFDLTLNAEQDFSEHRELVLNPVDAQVNAYRAKLNISVLGKESDQLSLTLTHSHDKIAQNYLTTLVNAFDNDGVRDRQLEYSRTIEFVNKREQILKQELSKIEIKKQTFKQENNITNIDIDASNNIDLKFSYNSEIFQLDSQKQIAQYLMELLEDSDYEYLPINIGLENFDLNQMINEYNKVVSERLIYKNEAGSNNFLVKSLDSRLDNLVKNISLSLNNFSNSLDLKLNNLKLKETEFDNEYNRVPENEKTLRSIERELSIKEALYLLLLQKREEASINLAVVKPTIKIIDYPITDYLSRQPNSTVIYLSSIVSCLVIYFLVLFIWFFMDNKIHNKEQLAKLVNADIPIICEIPYIKNFNLEQDKINTTRSVLSESIRMLLSNLRFTSLFNSESNSKCKTIIFTSSVKGEGKTLASVNAALSLANDLKKDKKVILLGTDLRNPQIHKNFDTDRSNKGISEIIYKNDHKNYVKKYENLDVLYSGSIPPNPTALLSSEAFKDLLLFIKNEYDYVIIDSAPCLLVSDTFEYIDLADSVVYLFRSNYTDSKIINFINDIYSDKNIKNLSIVLNAVGNSEGYGYKYGYQYGYNYGYGYGYQSDL